MSPLEPCSAIEAKSYGEGLPPTANRLFSFFVGKSDYRLLATLHRLAAASWKSDARFSTGLINRRYVGLVVDRGSAINPSSSFGSRDAFKVASNEIESDGSSVDIFPRRYHSYVSFVNNCTIFVVSRHINSTVVILLMYCNGRRSKNRCSMRLISDYGLNYFNTYDCSCQN